MWILLIWIYTDLQKKMYSCSAWLGIKRASVQLTKMIERKIVNILLSIKINIRFGAQTDRLIEAVLLFTHNVCFD